MQIEDSWDMEDKNPLLKSYCTIFDGHNYTSEQQSRWKEGELGSDLSCATNGGAREVSPPLPACFCSLVKWEFKHWEGRVLRGFTVTR